MVMPEVIAHVELAGHVAIHALRTRLAQGVASVFDGVVVFRLQALAVDTFHSGFAGGVVTLQAQAIAWRFQLRAVGVVAVAATHALVEHFALGKGAVFEHFVLDLAVQRVQLAGQDAWQVVVHQPLADRVAIIQRRAARVAAGTGFEFDGGVLVLEVDGKAGMDQVGLLRRPFQVIGRWAMTGLTADTQAVPVAVEGVFCRIEIALEAGGMAFDAHEVGVLARFAPVQRVLEVHALARVEVKPAVLFGIPGNPKGLQPAFADFDQVLLQGGDAKGIGHLEIGIPAIDARCVDPEFVAFAREHRGLLFGLEGDVVEVPEHRVRVGLLHRQLVMGALPVLDLLAVASLALLLVDHFRRRNSDGLRFGRLNSRGADGDRLGRRRCAAQQKPANTRHSQQQDADGDGEQITVDQRRLRIRVWLCSVVFIFRHYDFHGPGAIAVRRALKLDAALPEGRRLSNGIVLRQMAPSRASPLPHWICERHKSPVGAGLPAKAIAKALHQSPTNHR
ncbi:hypothetical protein D3C71_1146960 [compost metagenome]